MQNDTINKIIKNVSNVIVGKEDVIKNILKGIIAEGHILIEDVPGIGKTTLIKALGSSIDLKYNRVQFTTDLLPADILGVSIYDEHAKEFTFKKGPIFTNILLADEINRATTKAQSALLEAMEEGQVTEWGETYKLGEPFILMATQNPISNDGTFNLPHSQLDRFIMRIKIGYLDKEDEIKVLNTYSKRIEKKSIEKVLSIEDILRIRHECSNVYVKEEINEYIVKICRATRYDKRIALGVSTRGILALYKLSKANAYVNGRDYVIPEDVIECSGMALAHRIILSNMYGKDGLEEEIIANILKTIEIPKVK